MESTLDFVLSAFYFGKEMEKLKNFVECLFF